MAATLGAFSGINDRSNGVLNVLFADVARDFSGFPKPADVALHVESALGTGADYVGPDNVLDVFQSGPRLNAEAASLAAQRPPGEFCLPDRRSRIKVLLIAPKTHTRPPQPEECDCDLTIDVLWSVHDRVPNQMLFAQDSPSIWKPWGEVTAIDTSDGDEFEPGDDGFFSPHQIASFMETRPVMTLRPLPDEKGHVHYDYVDTAQTTADIRRRPQDIVWDWYQDDSNDFILVAHSQGSNILMACLWPGCRRPGTAAVQVI